MKEAEKSISLKKMEGLLNELVDDRNADELRELAEDILKSNLIVGSSDDFHNFAVGLAQLDDYEMSCLILERGISTYKTSVDLLADYLIYGIDCDGNREKCEVYYKTLRSIPDSDWTWRSFSFSLDYLQSRLQMTEDRKLQNRMREEISFLSDTYYKRYPNNERAYLAEARLFSRTDSDKELDVLEKAVTNLKFCPRCAFRYADLLINRAKTNEDYKKAFDCLENALVQKTESEINLGDAYFLRGLCLIQLLNGNDDYKNHDKIKEIYNCFHVAETEGLDLSSRYYKKLRKQVLILEKISKISYDED
jgi:tetratricopeptide (TPR) repeat protein